MLAAAWLARGGAWGLLRKASPGSPGGAALVVARARGATPTHPLVARTATASLSPPPSVSPARAASLCSRGSAAPARVGLVVGQPPRRPSSGSRGGGGGGGGAPRHSSPGPGSSQEETADRRRRRHPGGKELYENPWTIPNFLSMARISMAPVLGYLIVEEDFHIALGVFALAGVTDLLDGFIARNWANQKSVLGSALDPLADKILISVLYISLTCANLIPVPLTSMIILRDTALIAAVFYLRYKTLPSPRTVNKYFNPCYVTAQLKPTFISKVNTVVQLVLVAASLAAPVFNYVDSIYLQTLWCITACTTTASAYSYYHYGRKTVQVLNNK